MMVIIWGIPENRNKLGVSSQHPMSHFEHQAILDCRDFASFEERLRGRVCSIVSILEADFRREREGVRPDILS